MVQRICCFGNLLHGDDGIGPRLAEVLRHCDELRGVAVLDLGTDGLTLINHLASGGRTILVDAWRGAGPIGTVQIRTVLEVLRATELKGTGMSHGVDVPFALRAAQAELGELPPLYLVTVTVGELTPFCMSLSPLVAQAIPRAVAVILRLVRDWGKTPIEGGESSTNL